MNKLKALGNHWPIIDAFGNILAYVGPARINAKPRLILNPDFKALHNPKSIYGNPRFFDWKHQFSIHHLWLQDFYLRTHRA